MAIHSPVLDRAQQPVDKALPIVEPRNWVNIAGWVLLALFGILFMIDVFTNPRWSWGTVGQYIFDPQVLGGLVRTLQLTLIAGVLGIALGLVVGLMRMSKSPSMRAIATVYIGFVRAIPALVLILILYFAAALFPTLSIGIPFLPPVFEVPTNTVFTQFGAAIVGLTIIVGAHSAEIFRTGILSVARGQMEAARALSIPPTTAYRKVVLPQAIRVATPAFATELISLFKNTSLVSVIGYAELLTVVQTIYGRTYETVPLLTVAFLWYLVLTIISMWGQSKLEKKFSRGQ